MPAHLIRPKLRRDVVWVFQEFWRLNTCRSYSSNGPGPIPYHIVSDHGERMGLSPDEAEGFWMLIHAMDGEFLACHARRMAEIG